MQKPKFETHGLEGCDDCQWMAHETDGEILICQECEIEMADDEHQPDELTEWLDFDPDC
tara:strand:+ start:289 stop:465 length:177 start_codon:yes stop_codon:yes gene_type:complete